jgi:ABC-type uncharacterized transport system auxiliary subunit
MVLNGRTKILAPMLCALAALAACGCASVPRAHFYTLGGVALSAHAGSDSAGPLIRVQRLAVAEPYAGRRIVYRPTATEVSFWDLRRWAEPPDKMITAAAAEHLAASGMFRGVDSFPYCWDDADLILRGAVLAFEEVDRGDDWYGHVKLFLELVDARSRRSLWSSKIEVEKKAAERTPDALVEALTAALDEILTQAEGEMSQAVERSR